ncbi:MULTISPECIES: DUF4258 domain-containing protein [unclassified Moraxella]|uniref:DUF4258 domain-containing protein n=1 Tax=unclassified Moraxella TaxID=2685852 RepID=UPI003AF8D04D
MGKRQVHRAKNKAQQKRRENKLFRVAKTGGHFSYLSKHAVKRLRERTQMTAIELTHLLDNGGVIDIGTQPGTHRQSLLFYSPKDELCYVAVRGNDTGKIVTVWLTEFHNQLAWEVTLEQCKIAKQKYEKYQCQHELMQANPSNASHPASKKAKKSAITPRQTKTMLNYRLTETAELEAVNASTISPSASAKAVIKLRISALYINDELQHKTKTLLKFSMDLNQHYAGDYSAVWQDEALLQEIDKSIDEKSLNYEQIYALTISDSKSNLLKIITLRDRYAIEKQLYHRQQQYQAMYQLLAQYQTAYPLLTWQTSLDIKPTIKANDYQLPSWLKRWLFWVMLLSILYRIVKKLRIFVGKIY